ncbi:hypothetical protein SG34_002330 [Thalassomonas viridans]|uniref:Transcription elongation factor GreAB n=1 Tax=Thalassomonas viridans TaxID=137584 RepID=A0AAE9Z498_9GAMM|nr:membrane protein [Thalassomonas viridans]WDE05795.1 hypothetical protein SG34_002330 [Thalassomonas viridans]
MLKESLVKNIIQHLQHELDNATLAAEKAHLAAIDDQSVAETQYDTLAIEAGYLAQGQSRRIVEFQDALAAYRQLDLSPYSQDAAISLGHLVQLDGDAKQQHWFFLGPAAAGYRTSIQGHKFTVITPHSPMGKALKGKYPDDEICVALGKGELKDFIAAVC